MDLHVLWEVDFGAGNICVIFGGDTIWPMPWLGQLPVTS